MKISAQALIEKLEKSNKEDATVRAELQELELYQLNIEQLEAILKLLQEKNQSDAILKLDLRHNRLTVLPSELGQLVALQVLSLDYNEITELPVELGQLTALQELYLNDNKLTDLPAELGKLVELQILLLSNNQLTGLPTEIGQLVALRELYLGYNQLTALPAELGQLVTLQVLSFGYNQLTALPAEIGQLVALQTLILSNNQLTALPVELGQLVALKTLSLNNNQLTLLPLSLGACIALTYMDTDSNLLQANTPSTPAVLQVAWRVLQVIHQDEMLFNHMVSVALPMFQSYPYILKLINTLTHEGSAIDTLTPNALYLHLLETSINPVFKFTHGKQAEAVAMLNKLYRAMVHNQDSKQFHEILFTANNRFFDLNTVIVFGDGSKGTLLHAATRNNVASEFTTLLLQHHANPNQTDKEGWTPVGQAVTAGRADILALYQATTVEGNTWIQAATILHNKIQGIDAEQENKMNVESLNIIRSALITQGICLRQLPITFQKTLSDDKQKRLRHIVESDNGVSTCEHLHPANSSCRSYPGYR